MNLQSHIFLKEILDDFQLGKSRPWYPYGHCLQPGFFFDRAR